MKNTEIKALSTPDLESKITAEKSNLARLKFAHNIAAIENPMRIRESRKLVAKMMTELTARKNKEKQTAE